jgi:hypothetical protein
VYSGDLDKAQSGRKSFFSNKLRIKAHPFNVTVDLVKLFQSFFGSNKFKSLHAFYLGSGAK